MLFIYLFEADERYLSQVNTLFERVEKGEDEAIISMITPLEVLSAPKLEGSAHLAAFENFFQKTPHLILVPVNWEVMQEAAKLRRKYQHLRTPDSIQIATALVGGSERFVTGDVGLSQLSPPPLPISQLEKN